MKDVFDFVIEILECDYFSRQKITIGVLIKIIDEAKRRHKKYEDGLDINM